MMHGPLPAMDIKGTINKKRLNIIPNSSYKPKSPLLSHVLKNGGTDIVSSEHAFYGSCIEKEAIYKLNT